MKKKETGGNPQYRYTTSSSGSIEQQAPKAQETKPIGPNRNFYVSSGGSIEELKPGEKINDPRRLGYNGQIPKLDYQKLDIDQQEQLNQLLGSTHILNTNVFNKPFDSLEIPPHTDKRRIIRKSGRVVGVVGSKVDPEQIAFEKAKELTDKYGVKVIVVAEMKDCYSRDALRNTAENGVYFISKKDVEISALCTEHLINFRDVQREVAREKLNPNLDIANTKRVQLVSENNSLLKQRIEEIKTIYQETNKGKKPTLDKIAAILTDQKVESPGGSTTWYAKTVQRILGPQRGQEK